MSKKHNKSILKCSQVTSCSEGSPEPRNLLGRALVSVHSVAMHDRLASALKPAKCIRHMEPACITPSPITEPTVLPQNHDLQSTGSFQRMRWVELPEHCRLDVLYTVGDIGHLRRHAHAST
eukprot:6183149-Pleurochrysis_carterae.AAC.1